MRDWGSRRTEEVQNAGDRRETWRRLEGGRGGEEKSATPCLATPAAAAAFYKRIGRETEISIEDEIEEEE